MLGLGVAASEPWCAIGIGLALLGVVLLVLGARGWSALLRQPHVFLAP